MYLFRFRSARVIRDSTADCAKTTSTNAFRRTGGAPAKTVENALMEYQGTIAIAPEPATRACFAKWTSMNATLNRRLAELGLAKTCRGRTGGIDQERSNLPRTKMFYYTFSDALVVAQENVDTSAFWMIHACFQKPACMEFVNPSVRTDRIIYAFATIIGLERIAPI